MTNFKVYEAIAKITAEMSKDGIAKDRRNQQQGYSFRGIDDVYNALSPMLAEHKLCILPRIISRELVERQTSKGGALFYVTVEAEFDFVSAEDGSKHTIKTFGEAMDSADKATNKAMSAAYKYAAMQAFCIPTEGDNDADGTTHEVAPRQAPKPNTAPKNDDARKLYSSLEADMRLCRSADDLARWWKDAECVELRKRLPDDWQKTLHDAFAALGKELRGKEDGSFPGSTGTGVYNGAGRELHAHEAG